MAIIRRRSPFNTLRKLENELFSIFDEDETTDISSYRPKIDLTETDENFIIEADLPGMSKDEIQITASSDHVDLEAEKEIEKEEEKEGKTIFRERVNRKFRRRIPLNNPIIPNESKSTYDDGVLKLTLPKSEQSKSVKLSID